jgi:hypothetical protein
MELKNMKIIFCGVKPCSLAEIYGRVNIYPTTRCHITKDNTLHSHTREKIETHKFVNNMICMGFQFLKAVTTNNINRVI